MYLTEELATSCPYCGEPITVIADLSLLETEGEAEFIEDCEVCCRPINFTVRSGADGAPTLLAGHENDGDLQA